MHAVLAIFLICFSAWTIAVHLGRVFVLNLGSVISIFVIIVLPLFGLHRYLQQKVGTARQFKDPKFCPFLLRADISRPYIILVILVGSVPLMWFSWNAFWFFSSLILSVIIIGGEETKIAQIAGDLNDNKLTDSFVVVLSVFIMVVLSLVTSRSDLDDSYFAAIAAWASSNPELSMNLMDPTLGEKNLSLLYPTFQFLSFELISAAGAYLLKVPALDFYYIYLLPVWVAVSVLAIFLLTRELVPKHWVVSGCATLAITLLLGEMHRSPANFSFVRLYQGKAVFLSVVVPSIFYLTARYLSDRGTAADLFLLATCQVSSIGMSNIGMLMGPIAGFVALISNLLLFRREYYVKFVYMLVVLFIPVPYLMITGYKFAGSVLLEYQLESSSQVWYSIFGIHQQILVGILLLVGPALAKCSLLRWRLGVPSFLLFVVFMNPLLSEYVSKYITSPSVYWRVSWSFPVLVYISISFSLVVFQLIDQRLHILIRGLIFFVLSFAIIYSLPYHVLRRDNVEDLWRPAEWKIPRNHLLVSEIAAKLANDSGRLLAPEEIGGVISRFNNHPKLVHTRIFYLYLMKEMFSQREFDERLLLSQFVAGHDVKDHKLIGEALYGLDVSVIVLNEKIKNNSQEKILKSNNYVQYSVIEGYSIWIKGKNRNVSIGLRHSDEKFRLQKEALRPPPSLVVGG